MNTRQSSINEDELNATVLPKKRLPQITASIHLNNKNTNAIKIE